MLQIKPFNRLTLDELYAILKLRQDVFICEQACLFQDIDMKDQTALHVLKMEDRNLQGYARLIFEDGKTITIGRIVITLSQGDKGVGKSFMKEILEHLKTTHPSSKIRIDAQSRLEGFYQNLGFITVGPQFFFEGDPIPHLPMELVH